MEKYNIRDLLFEELIELTLEAEDFEDAIKKIGEDAYRKGYVKEGFADAVIKREKLYPTALPTEVLKVAIPHPMERDTVKKSLLWDCRVNQGFHGLQSFQFSYLNFNNLLSVVLF